MKKNKLLFLSVIIPVFNEEKRLKNLNKLFVYLKKQKYRWEVIIIDDGSTDKTQKVIKSLKKKLKFNLISHHPNKGKGAAIRAGMLSAVGKYRLFLDIDLSTPIEEYDKLSPYLKKYDIVIGSRKMKGSDIVVRQAKLREILGKLFTLISQKTLRMNISDFTCGFKCFSQKAAEEIFPKQTISRWGFDSEILFIGQKRRLSIKEIPVTWTDDPQTKVRFPQDILNSLKELIKIRVNSYRGLYK